MSDLEDLETIFYPPAGLSCLIRAKYSLNTWIKRIYMARRTRYYILAWQDEQKQSQDVAGRGVSANQFCINSLQEDFLLSSHIIAPSRKLSFNYSSQEHCPTRFLDFYEIKPLELNLISETLLCPPYRSTNLSTTPYYQCRIFGITYIVNSTIIHIHHTIL